MKDTPIAKYYILSMSDSNPSAVHDVEKQTKEFDPFLFYKGQMISDWPDGITFTFLNGREIEDHPVGGAYWELVSDNVKTIFEKKGVTGVQFLPVTVIAKQVSDARLMYWALNVYLEVEGLDWNHTFWSTQDMVKRDAYPLRYVIKEALQYEIVKKLDIFRLNIHGNQGFTIYISKRVKVALEKESAANGFKFFPIPAY